MALSFLVFLLCPLISLKDTRCANLPVRSKAFIPLSEPFSIQGEKTTKSLSAAMGPRRKIISNTDSFTDTSTSASSISNQSVLVRKHSRSWECDKKLETNKFLKTEEPSKKMIQMPFAEKALFRFRLLNGLDVLHTELLSRKMDPSTPEFQLFYTLELNVQKILNSNTEYRVSDSVKMPGTSTPNDVLTQWTALLNKLMDQRKVYSLENAEKYESVLDSNVELQFLSRMRQAELQSTIGIEEADLQFVTMMEAVLFASIEYQYRFGLITRKQMDTFFNMNSLCALGIHLSTSYQSRHVEEFEPSLSFLQSDPGSKYINACLKDLNKKKRDLIEFAVIESTIIYYACFCQARDYKQSRQYQDIMLDFMRLKKQIATQVVLNFMTGFHPKEKEVISSLMKQCSAYLLSTQSSSSLRHDISQLNSLTIQHLSNFLGRLLKPTDSSNPSGSGTLHPHPSKLYFSHSQGLCQMPEETFENEVA